MVHLDVNDVLVFGHGPVGSGEAFRAIMHGVVAAQAPEVILPDVLLVERGIGDVDGLERHRCGKRFVVDVGRSVHDLVSP